MSETPMQDLVTNIVGEYVGRYLDKKKGTELVGRIIKGITMTREGAGLPEKAGKATQFSPNEKSGAIKTTVTEEGAIMAEPVKQKKQVKLPPGYEDPSIKKPKTLAIVSMPYDNPNQDPTDQDGSAPFAIQSRD